MQTGDLIHRRTGGSEFGNHYGVALVHPKGNIDVIHRQKDNNGRIEPLDDFLKGYPLLRIRSTPISGLTNEQVLRKFSAFDAGAYDLILNNCEHYAYRLSGYWPVLSDTNRRILIGFLVVIVILSLISKS